MRQSEVSTCSPRTLLSPEILQIFVLVSFVTLAACGGGSNGENVAATFAVYTDKENTSFLNELRLVELEMPAATTKLSGVFPDDARGVSEAIIGPDGTWVIYVADQEIARFSELYLVNLATPGVATKLSGTLQSGDFSTGVRNVTLNTDGTRTFYLAEQKNRVAELYAVDLASPGIATKLSNSQAAEGPVRQFSASADGSQIVYSARNNGVQELYAVDVANPGVATQLNPPPIAGSSVLDFRLSIDGTHLVYAVLGDFGVDDFIDLSNARLQLFAVDLSNPGVASELSGASPPLEFGKTHFKLSVDGARVLYRAGQLDDGTLDLYTTELSNPGIRIKLNEALADGGAVEFDYRLSSDGARVFYRANQHTGGASDLFMVDIASPGLATQLNATSAPEGEVLDFTLDNDEKRAIYRARDADGIPTLYAVDLMNPGVATKLTKELSVFGPGLGAPIYQVTADDTRVVYRARPSDGLTQLYSGELANPQIATRLNGPQFPVFGSVKIFAIWP